MVHTHLMRVVAIVAQPTTLEWDSVGGPCKGVSLVDLSRIGAAGRTHVSAMAFLECERVIDPDVTHIECTPAWDARNLKGVRPQHPCYRIGLRGRDVGDQYDRPRMVAQALHSRWALVQQLEDYLLKCCRSVVMEINVSWQSEVEWYDVELADWIRNARGQRDARDFYLTKIGELVAAGKLAPGDGCAFDLDQSDGRPRMTSGPPTIMTLLYHGTLLHIPHQSPLGCLEQLEAHGWYMCKSRRATLGYLADYEVDMMNRLVGYRGMQHWVDDYWPLIHHDMFQIWLLGSMEPRINFESLGWPLIGLIKDDIDGVTSPSELDM